MRNKLLSVSVVGVLALGFGLSACGGDDDDDAGGSTTDTTAAADDTGGDDDAGMSAGAAVVAEDFTFVVNNPVPAGSDFVVENKDGTAHTFTSDDEAFDGADLGGTSTADVKAPAEPGEYKFHCEIHTSMTGTLTVE